MAKNFADTAQDRKAQEEIKSRADKSIAVLEKAFIRNGSGRYFVLREYQGAASQVKAKA